MAHLSTAGRIRRTAIGLAIAGLLLGSLLVPLGGHAAPPSDDLCGVTIVENLRLDHDLVCAGPNIPGGPNKFNGIVVGADGITINLNGHSITGSVPAPGSLLSQGVIVGGRTGVVIKGSGSISDFSTGVFVSGSIDVVVRGLRVFRNTGGPSPEGIFIQSSTTVEIQDNVIENNGVGVEIRNSFDVRLRSNRIRDNTQDGLLLRYTLPGDSGNVIRDNLFSGNQKGILFATSGAITPTGNTVVSNRIDSNECGIGGPTAGNVLKRNRFVNNVVDFC